ncbi:MAG: aldo/keto reductase [Acidobacteriota bacterium]|nr:aldo/keto reductase [Acidobacteriota bacterium]
MIAGFATPEGTARFASRFPMQAAAGFYREAQGAQVSSLGLGTYLGEMDEATDRGYRESVTDAALGGINFFDTSLNYRSQRSELSIGAALGGLIKRGELKRDELVVSTKAGFLTPNAIPPTMRQEDLAGSAHSIAPAFLADQLARSRENLGLETIDVFYLHNPETQLSFMDTGEFYRRIRLAFAFLEQAVSQGLIRTYGTATWDGYRRRPGAPDGLSLEEMDSIALDTGGVGHHFRYIQLPFNLAMPEALAQRGGSGTVLEQAARLGITVVASASLLQARLARDLPDELKVQFPGTRTDAQRAIQFTRSTPGITVALAGMSNPAHVRENLAVSLLPSLTEEQYAALYAKG